MSYGNHRGRLAARLLVLVVVAATAAAGEARAQQTGGNTVNWIGGQGDWNAPTQWAGGAVPGAAQRAGIDGGFDHVSVVHFPAAPGSGATVPSAANVAGVDVSPGDALVLHAGSINASGIVMNAGTVELHAGATIATQQHFWNLNSGRLVIDGGGTLSVGQELNLGSAFDSLEVRPRADGLPYDGYTIATFGSLAGTFNFVTEGISIDYGTPGQVRISGTPVPEPASGVAVLACAAAAAGRRGWRTRPGARHSS